MPSQDPTDRTLIATMGGYGKWAKTTDRTAATAPARAALEAKFLAEAGGDPKRADAVRKLYYLRLARKSAESRRSHKAGGPDAACPRCAGPISEQRAASGDVCRSCAEGAS